MKYKINIIKNDIRFEKLVPGQKKLVEKPRDNSDIFLTEVSEKVKVEKVEEIQVKELQVKNKRKKSAK